MRLLTFLRRHVIAAVFATIGGILVVGGYVLELVEIVSLGLPVAAWQGLGAALFMLSIVAVLYRWDQGHGGGVPAQGPLPTTMAQRPATGIDRKLLIALDDLYAEGVALRNALGVKAVFNEKRDRAALVTWSDKVVEALDAAGATVSERSRFRTLNQFEPMLRITGNDPAQDNLEAIWSEKLDRLRRIIDRLGR